MKLVSISCIKNESDIIETFVRVNAAFVDTFIFVDDSEDSTGDILNRLAGEGIRIFRLQRPNKTEPYRQEQMVLAALRFALDQNIEGDYFLLLDSDEFPKFQSHEHAAGVLSQIPQGHIGAFQWETYVPDTLEFDKLVRNGLQTSFRQRMPEGTIYEKVVIPRALVRDVYVSVGSHAAVRSDGKTLGKHLLSEKLAHFPVRSAAQIIKKNVSAVYWLMRKESRFQGEGYHVFEVLKQLVDCGFELTLDALRKVAVDYANEQTTTVHLGGKPSWIQPYELQYTDHDNRHLIKNLCSMLVNSWAQPFTLAQTPELISVLSKPKY
jgi:Glycosyl transferase family 2